MKDNIHLPDELRIAVKVIKKAILQSQYEAARSVNEKQLMLYYSIGKYISLHSRNGFWGQSAIDAISKQLNQELPGLRGFSARNLRNMRSFYEEWKVLEQYDSAPHLADTSAKMEKVLIPIWQTQMPDSDGFPIQSFLRVSFSHHILILSGSIAGLSQCPGRFRT